MKSIIHSSLNLTCLDLILIPTKSTKYVEFLERLELMVNWMIGNWLFLGEDLTLVWMK